MVNYQNYRFLKSHLAHLQGSGKASAESVGRYWFYYKHTLYWLDEDPFSRADKKRPGLPEYVEGLAHKGKPLSSETKSKIIELTRAACVWGKLIGHRLIRKISPAWITDLQYNGPESGGGEHQYVSEDEIQQLALTHVAEHDLAKRRDRAAACFLYASAMRAGAFVTMPISAVDVGALLVRQWPELGVETKGGKKATTFLLNFPELIAVIKDWDDYVRAHLPPDMPWYAPVKSEWGEQVLVARRNGKSRNQSLSKQMFKLCAFANRPYQNPHQYRHGHIVYGLERCRDMADLKAVSQNVLHDSVEITDSVYARLKGSDVQERISDISSRKALRKLSQSDVAGLITMIDNDQLAAVLEALAKRIKS